MTKDSSLPENDGTGMTLGLLESNLQAALSALEKKEEDLQDAEGIILLEQAKLSQTNQNIVFVKQKQIKKDLKKAKSQPSLSIQEAQRSKSSGK